MSFNQQIEVGDRVHSNTGTTVGIVIDIDRDSVARIKTTEGRVIFSRVSNWHFLPSEELIKKRSAKILEQRRRQKTAEYYGYDD